MKNPWEAYPQSAEVHWPQDEKIIGVLGVAPLATADFFTRCCARPVRKDWEHVRVLIDSNPKIPSRGRCLELGETDPVPFMRAGIEELIARGAHIIAVPCNTAHVFYDRYAAGHAVPVPSIIDVTAAACRHASCRKTLVLASSSVMKYGLYDRALAARGIAMVRPDEAGQRAVSENIEQIKQDGYDRQKARPLFDMARATDADSVILGCTELSVLFAHREDYALEKPVLDSNQCLADYCVDFARNRLREAGNE